MGKFVRYRNGLSVYMFMVNIEACHFVYITLANKWDVLFTTPVHN